MNKIIYNNTPLFNSVGSNVLILATVSLQPLKDVSFTTEKIKSLYMPAFQDYAITTESYKKKKILENLLGKCYWFGYQDLKQRVALIYVSKKYGRWHDPLIAVTRRTVTGLNSLLTGTSPAIEIHCEKLNLSNFDVPWIDTEKEINKVLQKFPRHRIIVHGEFN